MADDATLELLRKMYLKAASIVSRDHVYFVGPYGRRVSFASQQRRALNTVWALEQSTLVREGARVAVIGGGVAGLTTAAALLARKCLVWVYESRPDVVDIQSAASHRFVHPTVNFWPETPINPTTELPFFDWYASDGADIVRRLKSEWLTHFQERVTKRFPEAQVTKVEYSSTRGKVTVEAVGKEAGKKEYDLAIFATGFGSESVTSGANGAPYWERDYLEQRAPQAQKIVVSGTGDGGLIDTLRAIHGKFRNGELVTDVAMALSTTGIRSAVEELEKTVQTEAAGNLDHAALLYAEAYGSVISDTPEFCKRILVDSYYRSKPVTLIGKLPQPYSLYSAPIHKFMMAHAILSDQVIYTPGELSAGPSFTPVGGVSSSVSADICIARHGAEPPIKALLDPSELRELQENQLQVGDLLDEVPNPPGFWTGTPDYPSQDFRSFAFAKFRYPLASAYVIERYKRALALQAEDDVPAFMMERRESNQAFGVPSTLFGIRFKQREKIIANEL